ncbi:MAG: ABC transporter permease, partial [Muribaculaceae bacterium]|nr:ABC transporter permease [Muribaculaceae bacterium]
MNYLIDSLRLGWQRLTSRRIYLFVMVVIPCAFIWFFDSLMGEGLPIPVPVAVVDMDHSSMSRAVTRSLNSNQYIDINASYENFAEAMDEVKKGEIYGFFYIPQNFERDAISGENPAMTLYSNMSVFIPGTLAYKGFKTVGVTTKGGLVATAL